MGIPITKPVMGEREQLAVLEPLKSGWLVQGPKVAAFEKAVATFSDMAHAIATSSCTTALHMALRIAGIGPGDEVIVPSFTYIATANAVEYVGATPVFADIDLNTFNISAHAVEQAITPRTRAILPVHLFGLMADMHALMGIAKRHNLMMIEDAACAIGATLNERHPGSFGQSACLSFHPRKVITTGEGGMLLTRDADVAALARSLRDHGASVSDRARHEGQAFLLPDFDTLGYNYRMTDMQGAIGEVQMERLPDILAKRRELAERYNEALLGLPLLATPFVPSGYAHSYQAYVCLYGGHQKCDLENLPRMNAERNRLMSRLSERGIATRPGTHAVHLLGYYSKKYTLVPEQFPNAWIADHLGIALPLYPDMTDSEFDEVVSALYAELRG